MHKQSKPRVGTLPQGTGDGRMRANANAQIPAINVCPHPVRCCVRRRQSKDGLYETSTRWGAELEFTSIQKYIQLVLLQKWTKLSFNTLRARERCPSEIIWQSCRPTTCWCYSSMLSIAFALPLWRVFFTADDWAAVSDCFRLSPDFEVDGPAAPLGEVDAPESGRTTTPLGIEGGIRRSTLRGDFTRTSNLVACIWYIYG